MIQNLIATYHKKTAISEIIDYGNPTPTYFLFLSIATVITTLGLIANSLPIIIGGMIIAPLLTPVLTLGMGLATLSPKTLGRSLGNILNSSITVILLAVTTRLLANIQMPLNTLTLASNGIYAVVAFLSGIGATVAWLNKRATFALPGVSVAVTLVPPLCIAGISLANIQIGILKQALTIYGYNVVGIALGSTIVFAAYQFRKLRNFEEQKINK